MQFRLATAADLAQLASMRWAFRHEDGERPIEDESAFARRYTDFVQDGIHAQRWVYWIAETDKPVVVAHMAVGIIRSIPRPARGDDAWGYLTDCYIRPAFRQRGIGSTLLQHLISWARAHDLELLLVWPSERAHRFYERAGFVRHGDLQVLRLREYDAPAPPASVARMTAV